MDRNSPEFDPPIRRAKIRHRWLQFRLSTLMLMLAAGIGMSWLVAVKKRGERQHAAVEAIYAGGGWVAFDYQQLGPDHGAFNGDPRYRSIQPAEPPGPAWLRGCESFDLM